MDAIDSQLAYSIGRHHRRDGGNVKDCPFPAAPRNDSRKRWHNGYWDEHFFCKYGDPWPPYVEPND